MFDAISGDACAGRSRRCGIDGKAAGSAGITARRRLGAAFVPEERLGHGAAPRMKLSENALLTRPRRQAASSTRGFIDHAATLAIVERITEAFDVRKAQARSEAAALSGGNLQKFIVGREIDARAGGAGRQPADLGRRRRRRRRHPPGADRLPRRGAAVLVISQDLDEIFEISDRIAVMFTRQSVGAARAAEATREKVGLLMGGSRRDASQGGGVMRIEA